MGDNSSPYFVASICLHVGKLEPLKVWRISNQQFPFGHLSLTYLDTEEKLKIMKVLRQDLEL